MGRAIGRVGLGLFSECPLYLRDEDVWRSRDMVLLVVVVAEGCLVSPDIALETVESGGIAGGSEICCF